ncbi:MULTISPECIES: DUF1616 domain-containing protein [unclassified Meiothermus]|uniref:DUF1616 domain-containing protein n=1 Tax=unclassified Meiothermus TaxID=370471 RepID=UPI001314E05D|nr:MULTISPECIES: DUF1616 domain-containing protein [unclassified Meiothermus]
MRGRGAHWDLLGALILALAMSLWLVFWPGAQNPLRILLGFLVALAVPGYTLMVALFPRRSDLDTVERVVVSLGLAVVPVSLLGVILSNTWGIRPVPLALGLSVFTLLVGGIAVYRRRRLRREDWFYPRLFWSPRWLGWGVAAVALVFALSLLLRPSAPLTEFYLVGPAGGFEGYPRQVTSDAPVGVRVGVRNLEGRSMAYVLQVPGMAPLELPLLANGQVWEQTLQLPPPARGDGRLRLELYRKGESEPYREVYLVLKPGGEGAP